LDPTQLSTADNELSILDALTEADVDEIRLELALDILDYLFLTFSSDRRLILSLFRKLLVDSRSKTLSPSIKFNFQ